MGNAMSENVGYDSQSIYNNAGTTTGGRAEISAEENSTQKPVVAEENPKPPGVSVMRSFSGRAVLTRMVSFGSKKEHSGSFERKLTLEPCKEVESECS